MLLILAGLRVFGASIDGSTRPADLITIVDPHFNQTYIENEVRVKIHLSGSAISDALEIRLNGEKINDQLEFASKCGLGQECDEAATLPQSLLVNGINVLTADVEGPNQSVGMGRVQFEYRSPAVSGEPVKHLVPGVAVNANYLPYPEDINDPQNYEIIVGPGPDFPQRIYKAPVTHCRDGGINSVQILVLRRETLEVDSAVEGGTIHPGQQCFDNAGALNVFLKQLPAGRLVIANSFYGTLPNLNTTAIGGTDYSKPGMPRPQAYSIIGVTGATPGEAYESYQNLYPLEYRNATPLRGSLMLDNLQRYFFVSSEYREFEVIPNDPAYPDAYTSRIKGQSGGYSIQFSVPSDSNGGFVVGAIDKDSGDAYESYFLSTNDKDPTKAASQQLRMAQLLTDSPHDTMLFATTVGVPFASSSVVTANLFHVINKLGGTGYMLPKLTGYQSDGRPQAYTLITSNDPSYPYDEVIEQSSLWSTQKQTGAVQGLWARNHKNKWSVQSSAPEPFSDNAYHRLANYEWPEVSFQQMQDWPEWTEGEKKAYEDLTANNNHYPSVHTDLGCVNAACGAIRSYYSGGIGGGDSGATRIHYNSLVYPNQSVDYTKEDLAAVKDQLAAEQGYLANVYSIYGQYQDLTGDSQFTVQAQLSAVARNLDSSLRNAGENFKFPFAKVGNALSLIGNIPGVGAPFGIAGNVVKVIGAFQPEGVGEKIPNTYSVKLKELIDGKSTLGSDLANSNNTMFLGIVSDWGKLKTIGGGYGEQKAPWYMCANCAGSNIPRAGIPLLALGAKQEFYTTLLPLIYTLDFFAPAPGTVSDPRTITGLAVYATFYSYCLQPYKNVAANSWLSFPSINQANRHDLYMITEIRNDKNVIIPRDRKLFFPSSSLISDLFDTSGVESSGALGGGAELILDRFSSGSSRPLAFREGWRPGASCKPN